MIVAAWRNPDWLRAEVVTRGVLAGAAWGLTMGIGLPIMSFASCGVICLSEIAFTTAISVLAGIATIGPLAAFRHPPDAGATD